MDNLEGLPFVKNRQVDFDFGTLPGEGVIQSIESIDLRTTVSKVSEEKNIASELLCFVDQKVCSGVTFSKNFLKKTIDTRFMSEESLRKIDPYFSEQILASHVGDKEKSKIYSSDLILNLERIFNKEKSSLLKMVKKLIYLKKSLRVVVADDVYLDPDTKIVLVSKENYCL